MALKGHAFLALWNDIARAREPEYDRWHTEEHVPERVAVTGINEARRYVGRSREHHRYFTLYDVESLAVFDSAEYVELLREPTPWSSAMRPDFSNFVRAPCALERSLGLGIGAAIACLCLMADDVQRQRIPSALAAARVMPRVNACHWGRGAGGLPTVAWKQSPASTVDARPFDTVLLLEALDRAAAQAALDATRDALGMRDQPPDFGADVYDLAFVFPGADAVERRRHRRPHWAKLA